MNGAALRLWRKRMGWSQVQAANALAMTRRGYQHLENSYQVHHSLIDLTALFAAARSGDAKWLMESVAHIVENTDAMPKPGRPKGKRK